MNDAPALPLQFRPYIASSGFGVITCYFNPQRYRSKLWNYLLFSESLRASGVPWLTIECLFPGQASELTPAENVHTVVTRATMWQKERLLNLALERLPREWVYVAWLDCDILFENRNWIQGAVAQLNRHAVVQLFTDVVRLPQGERWGRLGDENWMSFAAIAKLNPNQLLKGDFARHGHTGFAWAAHRDILARHGLYDGCIAGSGDHMMAHAFTGDWSGNCIDRILGKNNLHREHFASWASAIYRSIRARVSYVPGAIFHLWHGDTENRRYVQRNQELASFHFDPAIDLKIGENGCWEWASDKPELHRWAMEYFANRKEDGAEEANMATAQIDELSASLPGLR
jgi:endonuclease/exonuclease/phosphatase family metal-dependent hydrolase